MPHFHLTFISCLRLTGCAKKWAPGYVCVQFGSRQGLLHAVFCMSELLVGGITVTVPLFPFLTFLFVSGCFGSEVKKVKVMSNLQSVHFACAVKGSVFSTDFTVTLFKMK